MILHPPFTCPPGPTTHELWIHAPHPHPRALTPPPFALLARLTLLTASVSCPLPLRVPPPHQHMLCPLSHPGHCSHRLLGEALPGDVLNLAIAMHTASPPSLLPLRLFISALYVSRLISVSPRWDRHSQGKGLGLFYSLLCSQGLEKCLVRDTHVINTCEWMN